MHAYVREQVEATERVQEVSEVRNKPPAGMVEY